MAIDGTFKLIGNRIRMQCGIINNKNSEFKLSETSTFGAEFCEKLRMGLRHHDTQMDDNNDECNVQFIDLSDMMKSFTRTQREDERNH